MPVTFYGRNATTSRPRWIAPNNGEDSELEIEDDDIDVDDDILDPDFLLLDTDDVVPTTSGK